MSSATIDRLNVRLHSPVAIDVARREAWLAAFAAQGSEALGAGRIGDGEWVLIRRLQLKTRWRLDAVDADVGLECARALREAIEATLDSGPADGNCVRYANRQQAIADLLYRSALGDTARLWAWCRMGWLARDDGDAQRALATGMALLLREPELIWPVLHRLIAAEADTAALTALLRALPGPDWQRLFAACPQTAVYARLRETKPKPEPAAAGVAAFSPAAQRLLAWAARRPPFAARHADTLNVLLAALGGPVPASDLASAMAGSSPTAAAVRRWLAAREALRERLGAAGARPLDDRGGGTPPRKPRPDAPTGAPADGASMSVTLDRARPGPPELPETLQWQTTAWAGALFWLARVAASEGWPCVTVDDDSGDALPKALRAIVQALGVPPEDPAFDAFCGGAAPTGALPAASVAWAAACVAQWTAWLDAHAPELPVPRMRAVCQREGRLRSEPGWLAVHLPLRRVDPCVRRLGLDLDPGWLPWLGCVVRFHYDD